MICSRHIGLWLVCGLILYADVHVVSAPHDASLRTRASALQSGGVSPQMGGRRSAAHETHDASLRTRASALRSGGVSPPGFRANDGGVRDAAGAARPDILYTLTTPAAQLHLRRDGLTHVLRDSTRAHRVDLRIAGGNVARAVTAADPVPGLTRRYGRGDGTAAQAFRTVTYHDLQPGVDMIVRAAGEGAKVDLVVRPGVRACDVAFVHAGADRAFIAESGALVFETALGTITEERPLSYITAQTTDDGSLPADARIVHSAWRLDGDTVRIEVADPRREGSNDLLVVDPGIVWSTFAGGGDEDWSYGVAVNAAGDVHVAGATRSGNFPVHLGLQPAPGGDWDAFITKYSAGGTLLWSTFLGGLGEEYAHGIAVDATGAAVVAGWTSSANFPVLNAAQPALAGDRDAFVAKISATGVLVWSTYHGGTSEDRALGVDVDAAGEVAITGWTFSQNFPVRNAHQPALTGYSDLFVAKFSLAGTPRWSTYLGGGADDEGWDVATGPAGAVAVVGRTRSSNFPLLSPAQSIYGGDHEVVIARFTGAGALQWCTFLGGTQADIGRGITMDPTGIVYVTGQTASGDFPARGAWQGTKGMFTDVFVARYLQNGTASWATFLGGFGADAGNDVHALASGDVIVTGSTGSFDFPLRNAHQNALFGDEVFVARFSAGGTLTWSTFLGANSNEGGSGITWSATDNAAVVTGTTNSADFPVQAGQQSTYGGGAWDAFVTKLGECTVSATAQALGPTHLCEGETVTLEASDGIGYEYQWMYRGFPIPGAESRRFIAPDSGSYAVQIRNSAGCISTSNAVLVSRSTPRADAGRNIIVCPGGTERLAGQAFSGRAPYTVRWSPGSVVSDSTRLDPIVSVTRSTELVLTVVDSTGCTSRDTLMVLVDSVRIRALPADTICPGRSTQLSVDVLAGVPPYSYDWTPALAVGSPSARTTTATPTATTTFRIRVTDAVGCEAVDSVRVIVRSFEVRTSPDTLLCHGDAVTLRAAVGGGKPPYIYRWLPQVEMTGADTPSPVVRPQQTTVYTVQVTDALGCISESSVRVSVRAPFRPGVQPAGGVVLCEGDSVVLRAVPGFRSYRWDTGDTTSSIVVRRADRYICAAVNDDGCTGRDTVYVQVAPAPDPVITLGGSAQLCAGDSVTLEVQDGFASYLWSTGETTRRITVRAAGIYWAEVRTAAGCTARSAGQRIIVVPAPTAAVAGPMLVCADAVAEYVAPQQPNVSYTWTVTGGTAVLGLGTSVVRVQWGRGPTGTVHLRMAVDSSGCVATARLDVAMDSLARPEISPRGPLRICAGEQRELDAGPGFSSYLWSTGDTTRRITVTQSGRYLVRVSSSAGCAGYDSVDVDVLPAPAPRVFATARALCDGDSVVLRLDGAYPDILWSTGDTTASIVARSAGSFFARVRTAEGCAGASDTIAIVEAAAPPLALEGDTLACAGRMLRYVALAPPGMQFMWEVTGGTIAESDPADTVHIRWLVGGSGLLRVMITDPATGCTSTRTREVLVSAPLHVSVVRTVPSPLCAGDSVVLEAEGGFLRYEWSTGETTRSIIVRTSQLVTLTAWDVFGCPAFADTIAIAFGATPDVVLEGPATACIGAVQRYHVAAGGSTRVQRTVTGGTVLDATADSLTVRWDVIGDGGIALTATDTVSGCSAQATLRVRVDTALAPVITVLGSADLCEGDSVLLDAGPGFVAHLWNTGATTRTITVSQSGAYSVSVRDATGCSGTAPAVDVRVHARLQPAIAGPDAFCAGDTIILRAADAYAGYRWSTGDTTAFIRVTRGGSYGLLVVDARGCAGSAPPRTIIEHPLPVAPVVTWDGSILRCDSTGQLQWFVDGQPIAGATTTLHVPTRAGSYAVRATNAFGCARLSDSLRITPDQRPSVVLSLPALTAEPGARVVVPVLRTGGDVIDPTQAGTFHVRLHVPAALLAPIEATSPGIVRGAVREVTFASTAYAGDTLAQAVFVAMLGDVSTGPLRIDSAWWSMETVDVARRDGAITIEVCEEGGARLYDASGTVRIVAVHPNPFNASADITFEVIERGPVTLDVIDGSGRLVVRLVDADRAPGTHTVSFDARELATGAYTCVLRAGRIVRTQRLLLLK